MSSVCEICSTKCFGIDGYDGSCCSLEGRDFIMGPILDDGEFIERLNSKLGREFRRSEVFIEFEEGKHLFPDKSVWQDPKNFPALRVDVSKYKLPCVFYNTHAKFCTVHDIRPKTCRDYFCQPLMDELGMKPVDNSNVETEQNVEDRPKPDPFGT